MLRKVISVYFVVLQLQDIICDYQSQQSQLKVGDLSMPEKWTGEIVGDMHVYGISPTELAEKIGIHPKYLSKVLNGHRNPKDAESYCRKAINELIKEKEAT